jgi:4-carboxymuconolactone decarboxylase
MRRHTPIVAAALVIVSALAARLDAQTETNELRSFKVHPASVDGVMPFANYIRNSSSLPQRHRELLILRTAWLSRSPYYWSVHNARAGAAGLTRADITRIAGGPTAPGLDAFEAALLRAADELHHQSFVSDATWAALSARYTRHQLMDAVFTVTEFSMLAAVANTLRTPVDAGVRDVPLPAGTRPLASSARRHVALARPRVPPIEPADMTPAIRTMLDPRGNGRPVAAVYRTFAQHPALYVTRQVLSEYIRLGSTLSPRVREMLILRIGYLCQSAYEWAAHARAGRAAGLSADEIKRIAAGPDAGWSAADAAILRAVDEIYAADVVSEATWKELGAQFDRKQLLDVLITAGGYRMVSMALNTFGVPLEPDSEPLPPLP